MLRDFLFTYKEKKKNGFGLVRNKKVSIAKATGDIGIDAKAALGVFISATGNLKKNEIISIQELDILTGKPIGEPIIPVADTSIVPTGR